MSDVAAAFLLEQIKDHAELKARRQKVLAEYDRHLNNVISRGGSGHLCVIDCGTEKIRDMYRRALDKSPNIQWGHHYPLNRAQRETCPNAAALSGRILTLPCHPNMSAHDVRRVVARLLKA